MEVARCMSFAIKRPSYLTILHRILAALHFPALFSSMIIVDAIIDTFQGATWEFTQYLIGATLIRRNQWPSR